MDAARSGRITWGEFSRRYRKELKGDGRIDKRNHKIKNHGQKFTLPLLQKLGRQQNVTLMCHCAEDQQKCHRHLLKKILQSKISGDRLRSIRPGRCGITHVDRAKSEALINILWIGVTTNPTAQWLAHQITEAFPWDTARPFSSATMTALMARYSRGGIGRWAFVTALSRLDRRGGRIRRARNRLDPT